MNNSDFVNVKEHAGDIEIELRYSTENNFTGKVIYGFKDAYLRYGTLKKLEKVQNELKMLGYRLKIWDAFRPVSAQFKLWEVYPDATFVANPLKGFSDHSRGNTVDVTIVNEEGIEVVMPTEFDDFSEKAMRNCDTVDPEGKRNSAMLEEIMKLNGFVPYVNEWWHYSDEESYPVEKDFEPEKE